MARGLSGCRAWTVVVAHDSVFVMHGLSICGAWTLYLWRMDSLGVAPWTVVVAHGFFSYGAQVF